MTTRPSAQAVAEAKGWIEKATEVAERIGDAKAKDAAWFEIARSQSDAGDVGGLKMSAPKIADQRLSAHAYNWLAKALASSGNVAEAKQVVARITDKYGRASSMQDIAEAQVEHGDAEGAKKTAAEIGDELGRHMAFMTVVRAMARRDAVGAKRLAAEAAEGEKNGRGRFADASDFVTCVVEGQTQAGDIKGATETAKTISDPKRASDAFSTIAMAQAERSDIGAATSFAQSLPSGSAACELYWTVGLAEARSGKKEDALRSFAAAKSAADKIDDEMMRSDVLSELGRRMVRAGFPAEAARVLLGNKALTLKVYGPGSMYYAGIAESLARAGQSKEAEAMASEVANLGDRAGIYAALGESRFASGNRAEFSAWAKSLKDPLREAMAYLGAARACLDRTDR